jgi:hypothetical protein
LVDGKGKKSYWNRLLIPVARLQDLGWKIFPCVWWWIDNAISGSRLERKEPPSRQLTWAVQIPRFSLSFMAVGQTSQINHTNTRARRCCEHKRYKNKLTFGHSQPCHEWLTMVRPRKGFLRRGPMLTATQPFVNSKQKPRLLPREHGANSLGITARYGLGKFHPSTTSIPVFYRTPSLVPFAISDPSLNSLCPTVQHCRSNRRKRIQSLRQHISRDPGTEPNTDRDSKPSIRHTDLPTRTRRPRQPLNSLHKPARGQAEIQHGFQDN